MAAAEQKVADAQQALLDAQNALLAAQQLQSETAQAVTQAELSLQIKGIDVNQKAEALAVAKDAVDQAQANYDNNLIGTPIENGQPTIPGLKADIYNYSPNNLPNRTTEGYTYCKTITVANIDKNWDGGDIEGCGGDFVLIHYTGFITVPKTDSYSFLTQADDGWYMTIGDTVVNDNWVLKGCGGWWSQPIQLEANKSYPIDAWFYEYGGGACNQLIYMDSTTWNVAPESWFSQNEQTPMVYTKDPALLALLEQAQSVYDQALADYNTAQTTLADAVTQLANLRNAEFQNRVTMDIALQNVTTQQEELSVAQQELETIPPFQDTTPVPTPSPKPVEKPTEPVTPTVPEPVTPTPKPEPKPELPVDIKTVDPQTLTNTQVAELISVANDILNNSTQGSPEYQQALDALFVAAQADDIQLDPSLAAIPGLSAAVDAINFMGNVGADMSPKVREKSKKVVVTAVVAVGAAVNAATGAALMAAPTGGTSNIIRRKL